MKPVNTIARTRWYLVSFSGGPGEHHEVEVHSEHGSFKSYTAADRVLYENDPDAINEPGSVLQRRKEKYKHLRPMKGYVLLRNYTDHRIT